MKYKYILLLLFFLTFKAQAYAQKSVSYSLSWKGLQSLSTTTDEKKVLIFDDAVFLDASGLPYFSQSLPYSENAQISIKNVVWDDFLTDDEKHYLADKSLADSLLLNTRINIDRKKKIWVINFLPIIKDAHGNYKKVRTFDVEVSSLQQISKKGTLKVSGIHQYVSSSVLANGKWVKIRVPSSGIYKLTYSDLLAMGISNPSSPRIFGYGGAMLPEDFSKSKIDDLPEMPIWMEKGNDGIFNSGDYILFYAQGPISWELSASNTDFVHTVNPYSKYGYYFVTSDAGEGKKIPLSPIIEETPNVDVDYFLDYQLKENDLVNMVKSGREWFGEEFNTITQRSFSFSFPNIYSALSAVLVADVIAISSVASSFSVYANNVKLGSNISIPKLSSSGYEKAKQANAKFTFTPDIDDITILLQYNKSTNSSTARLNYLRLNVYRQLKMTDNTLFFRNPSVTAQGEYVRYLLSDAPPSTVIWDITNPQDIGQVTTIIDNNQLAFVADVSNLKQFVALLPSASYPKPEIMGIVPNQNLHALSNIDFVIIAAKDFLSQANRLAQAHIEHDNMTVEVVTPEQVYNEFSSGTPDATAYRWLMKMLYDKASVATEMPLYLMLFGDGSYDNREISIGNSQINRLLTYQSVNSLVEADLSDNSYVCDDYFGFLDDNEGVNIKAETMDIGIGRFPVSTQQQAADIVTKNILYMQNTKKGAWKNQICYVGDDEDSNLHMYQADTLAIYTEKKFPELQVSRIFLDAYLQEKAASGESYPAAKEKLLNLIKSGALLINFTGHGSTEGWTSEKILTRNDIVKLYNDKFPLFVTATCDFSRFDDKASSSGEELFWNSNGGAIALFSTSRTVYTGPNFELNKSFNKQVFITQNEDASVRRLGDISRLSKNSLPNNNNKMNFLLLGNPALRIPYPSNKVITSEIKVNGVSSNTMQALSLVEINGYIASPNQNKLADFNGSISVTVYDKEQTITTLANNGGNPYKYKDYPNILYSGKALVTNGDFSIQFLVPKDIAYNYGNGRINYYAADETNDYEANGFYTNFLIGGENPDFVIENEGPEITMYLNTPVFKNGDKVNENPVFMANVSDESGINTVGSGIGHDIILMLNQDPMTSYVLNNYFEFSIGSFKSGSVTYPLYDLPEGTHSLFFRVWDVLNNSSSKTIDFEVVKGLTPELYKTYVLPNPVQTSARIMVSHDRPLSLFQATVVISDLTGKTVRSINKSVFTQTNNSEICDWDLKDNNGRKVPSGIYVYRVTLNSTDGQVIFNSNKIIVSPL